MYRIVCKYKRTVALMILSLVISQTFAQYEIKKYTINNGGSSLSAGGYKMTASIGQTDAGQKQSVGNYSLNGGFWQENNDLIFRNGVE